MTSVNTPADEFAAKMDAARAIAMCSIVLGHTLIGWEHHLFFTGANRVCQAVLLEMSRVGTVIFFLISGYFLSVKLPGFTVISYLKYRLHSLIIPWIIFVSLFVLVHLLNLEAENKFPAGKIWSIIVLIRKTYVGYIFHAAYWFVPVSIISAIILIVLKKQANQGWLGIVLLLCTLFYGVNLYYNWIPAEHTKAVLGYVFFMWLGLQVNTKSALIKPVLNKLKWPLLLTVVLLFFVLTCLEGANLLTRGAIDPFASIRVTNVVLSVLIFACIIKTNRLQWVKVLKPQQYTYGVYLVHCIIISQAIPYFKDFFFYEHIYDNIPELILLNLAFFAIMLSMSYLVAVEIKKSPLSFMTGGKRIPRKSEQKDEALPELV